MTITTKATKAFQIDLKALTKRTLPSDHRWASDKPALTFPYSTGTSIAATDGNALLVMDQGETTQVGFLHPEKASKGEFLVLDDVSAAQLAPVTFMPRNGMQFPDFTKQLKTSFLQTFGIVDHKSTVANLRVYIKACKKVSKYQAPLVWISENGIRTDAERQQAIDMTMRCESQIATLTAKLDTSWNEWENRYPVCVDASILLDCLRFVGDGATWGITGPVSPVGFWTENKAKQGLLMPIKP